MPGIVSRLFRRTAPVREEQRDPSGLAPTPTPQGAPRPQGPEERLRSFLAERKVSASQFVPGELAFLVSDAVFREELIQVWSTQDWLLKDVRLNGTSLVSEETPAWFALSSLRVATGRVSKNWKEQLARASMRYTDIRSVSCERATDGKWHLMAWGLAGNLDLVFDPGVEEAMVSALADFIQAKGAGIAA